MPNSAQILVVLLAVVVLLGLPRAWRRLQLSRAKHPGLVGHPRTALRLSRLLPHYAFDEAEAFGVDGAPTEVVDRRREAFQRLGERHRTRKARTIAQTTAVADSLPDVPLTTGNRVPFPFRDLVQAAFPPAGFATEARGSTLVDLDGNELLDLSGSYGVDLLGVDLYRRTLDEGLAETRDLGLVLGPYHPVLADNVARLQAISGKDAVTFHMSGTEAVMQAMRVARYHTRRRYVVRFAGAYHGWSGEVQAGPGNPLPVRDVLTLSERSARTLGILRTRRDIAAVLVNPLQALSPNAGPKADGTLINSTRSTAYDRAAHTRWLQELRQVCTERGIVLVFDEVFLGFRLAPGGAQEFFGVQADLVTYGKTLGGGLPVGVVCGRADVMKRTRDDRPADLCFARGTFNSLPVVMGAMNAFLRALDTPEALATYADLEPRWDTRRQRLNAALEGLPLHLEGMVSIWSTIFEQPSRYNWMFRFYLEDQGLHLPWTGTGRFVLPHSLTDAELDGIIERFRAAAEAMQADGWWHPVDGLTNKSIGRMVARESLDALMGRR